MRGFTLLELMVVVLVLGIVGGVSAVALSALRPPARAQLVASLEQARDSAIFTGQRVLWEQDGTAVRFEADGSSSGGTVRERGLAVTVDPLTGALHASR